MSIREIKEIPVEVKTNTAAMIRKDIEEAIEKHIELFEFEGDYNWKYMAQRARCQSEIIFRNNYFHPTYSRVKREIKAETGTLVYLYVWEFTDNFIKITSHKLEDRIHVYCHIDFDYIEKLYDEMIEEARKKVKR